AAIVRAGTTVTADIGKGAAAGTTDVRIGADTGNIATGIITTTAGPTAVRSAEPTDATSGATIAGVIDGATVAKTGAMNGEKIETAKTAGTGAMAISAAPSFPSVPPRFSLRTHHRR
ncbi:MAG: hypothetical protein WA948_03335, partial [Pontixanthobacter sp.]